MAIRYVCTIDNCRNSYSQKTGLKAHQCKKHNDKTGMQMKRMRADGTSPDEPQTASSSPPSALQHSMMPLETLHQQCAELRKELNDIRSEVFAHVTDMRQQMSLLAKKNMKWCVVCFERENNYAFEPCHHKCVCRECAQTVLNGFKKCPICREVSLRAHAIYDVAAWEVEAQNE
jgi:hypothetical protein